ncbi:membrane dipeptidase [Microbacterium dextranolyticum]|uniref:Glutamine amidotransferase domain-containing protein n=1 Tax=Microbacterium dextranolyticum TaxID=36806 RepID=A0A9W6HLA3_9MICO|nr:membrane dipeptidase [Microbacterium dextranolyticum]MBM7464262.1 microsomal dipeptidase-like Zn-dependent dipeptidase/GMP synthase-like glutamine amidotransferase [Microbacterium dextranolyticum]GLJ95256.1 hypothetical protein GCM10017591_13180 [Microbacterium dextranolyticum]
MHLVIDGHNDLPWALRSSHGSRVAGVASALPDLHTDIPRLRRGGVGGQFWSVWVDPTLRGAEQVTATLEQIDLVRRLVDAHPDHLAWAPTASDLRAAMKRGRIGSLIGVEGGAQIDGSLGVLRQYARLGARYLTLTWSRTIAWADSATDAARHGGLTPFGRDVVREMNRIGMLVDLAHVSPDTMRDALDTSVRPVIVSHSGAHAVCGHPRNVPDDVLARIGASGGVVMVTFVPSFLSPERRAWVEAGEVGPAPVVDVAAVADHVEHVRAIAGISAVGLGGDYDGTDAMPAGLDDVAGYPALVDELARRGWTSDDLDALTHGNILRVLGVVDEDYRTFLAGTAGEPVGIRPAVDLTAAGEGTTRRPRVLVVQNAKPSGPRRLSGWLRDEGLDPEVMLGAGGLPSSLEGFDGLVMLGGGLMPDDDAAGPWLAAERALARQAIDGDIPTLGICLGGQILAHVGGGEVAADTGPKERGATEILPTAAGRTDAVIGGLGTSAHMIENHQDMITRLPPGAVLLASSRAVANQAFRLGENVRGLQFHPEVGADDLLGWEEPTTPAPGDEPLAVVFAGAQAVEAESTRASRALVAGFAADVRREASLNSQDPADAGAPGGTA